jgi:hypothetical protein
MRLRQVAYMAEKIAPVAAELEAVFDLHVGYRDPGVGVFGLANIVEPVGGEFLEVLEPMREDASGARYLQRRGGDAGYMVILQDADSLAHRERIAGMGVRVIAKSDGRYRYTHFHPGDCAGVLLSIDSVEGDDYWREPKSDWPPAGRDWRGFESGESLGIAAVSIQNRHPDAAAARWAELLATPARGREIALERGVIRFVEPVDADGTGVVGLDVEVRDPAKVLAAAKAKGLGVEDGAVRICGVAMRPIARGA